MDGQVFVGVNACVFGLGTIGCLCVKRPDFTHRASGLDLVGQLFCLHWFT